MDRFQMQEYLIENLGLEEAFDSVVLALGEWEFEDIFNYICRMNDLRPEEEEEEEED